VGWAELEPWDRRARLASVYPRLTEDCVVAVGRTIPELRPAIDAQRSKEDRVRVAVRYFGDEGHANPDPDNPPKHGPAINGNIAAHDCPPWERLPPIEAMDAAESGRRERELSGEAGRPPETMPITTFWAIYEMGMAHATSDDETPSLRAITETTRRREDLEYIPRDRVTPIVDWIAANRRRARGYWERREIPPQFRATVTD
jgi:hypothetical protein